MTSVVAPKPLLPPVASTPANSQEWQNWHYRLYQMLLEDGGVFPTVSVQGGDGTGRFSAEKNMFQRLVSLDCGLYSDYTASNGNIIYGFAANVRRSGGNELTVGAQLNAWSGPDGVSGTWGIATEAWTQERAIGAAIGNEASAINLNSSNTSAKVGFFATYKNRPAGAAFAPTGLGPNRYNYYSSAHWIASNPRSALGEFCGWTRGISFLLECFDLQTPLVWSAVAGYSEGMVVSSGGMLWQAIQASVNQLPAVPSIYWVLHNPFGVVAGAIGIDFSCLPLATLGRTASAIRLRDSMRIDYEVTGAVGSFFDPVTGLMNVVNNAGVGLFAINVVNGEINTTKAFDAPGGGAAATLATVGGAGPVAAAQAAWYSIFTPGGRVWIPVWQ